MKSTIIIEFDPETPEIPIKLYKGDGSMLPKDSSELQSHAINDIKIISEALRLIIKTNSLNGYVDSDKAIVSVMKHLNS